MKKIVLILLFVTAVSNGQWVQVNSGMGNITVRAIISSGNNIFAGIFDLSPYNGVYLSTNNGTTWTQTSLNYRQIYSFAINGNNIFAGTAASTGVYLSSNNGTNWTQTSLNNLTVISLAIIGNNIFAGTDDYYGVYLSTNNGTNWTQTSLNNLTVFTLAVNVGNILAGTRFNGVYLSTNNGTTWTQTNLNNRTVISLAENGNNIFAGTGGYGVYVSNDNGNSWTQTNLNNRTVLSLAENSNNIFAGTHDGGVYISSNNGASWTLRNEGLGNTRIEELSIINNYIFAGTYDSSVYRRPLGELIGIQPISNEIPSQFSLSQNYPNPFNPTTKIRFSIGRDALHASHGATLSVSLRVFDVLGREVATLVNEQLKPGTYEVEFDGSNFSSGIYYYTLSASTSLSTTYTETKKMVLIK